jgi:hypothetical protein
MAKRRVGESQALSLQLPPPRPSPASAGEGAEKSGAGPPAPILLTCEFTDNACFGLTADGSED